MAEEVYYRPAHCDFTLGQIERALGEWKRRVETLGERDVRVVVTRNLPVRDWEEDERTETMRYRFEAVYSNSTGRETQQKEEEETVDVELIGLRSDAAFNAVDACIRGAFNLFISSRNSFGVLIPTAGNMTLTLPWTDETVSWRLDRFVRSGVSLAGEMPVSPRVCALVASPHNSLEAVQLRSRQLLAALPLLQAVLVVKFFARSRVDRTFACAAIVYVRDPPTGEVLVDDVVSFGTAPLSREAHNAIERTSRTRDFPYRELPRDRKWQRSDRAFVAIPAAAFYHRVCVGTIVHGGVGGDGGGTNCTSTSSPATTTTTTRGRDFLAIGLRRITLPLEFCLE